MQPKITKQPRAITPVAPEQVFSADVADPDKAAEAKAQQIALGKGKYAPPKGKPFKSSDNIATNPAADGWVEIALIDERGNPAAGQKYEIILPNGMVAKGSTDEQGKAKVEGFVSGVCQLTLPELDSDAW